MTHHKPPRGVTPPNNSKSSPLTFATASLNTRAPTWVVEFGKDFLLTTFLLLDRQRTLARARNLSTPAISKRILVQCLIVLRYHFPLNLRPLTPTLVCSPKLSPNTNKIDPSNRIGRKLSLPPLTLQTISPKCKGINNLGASRTLPPRTTTSSSRPRRSTHNIKRYKIPHHVSIRTTMVADKDSQTPTITPTVCPHLTLTISPSPNKCNTHLKT